MDPTLLSEYFNHFEALLTSEDNFDVKIQIGSDSSKKEIHAHSSVLRARCSYFKNALGTATKQNDHFIIKKPNISELLIKTILKFLYTCKIEFDNYTGIDVLKLIISAEELCLDSLYKYTMKYFIENQKTYIKENPIKILRLIYTNSKFDQLKNICFEHVCVDSDKLFKSPEYTSLEKPILLDILKKDDFCVDEIEAWENILKWGLAKHPGVNNNVDYWSIQNYANLADTLKQFILLIRFKDITNRDFFTKVVSYQMLFPKELWLKLLNYYIVPEDQPSLNLLPPRILKIEQIIMNQNVTLLFASWIDKKTPTYTSSADVKYKFKLLYRKSKDGLNAAAFHKKCDNISKTLVIAKIQNSEQIIGGYNPLDWNGNGIYKNTAESFIFNITNRTNTNSAAKYFSYAVNNQNNAIYCNTGYLPTFGGGNDILFNANSTVSINNPNNTYSNVSIGNGSTYEELEVYQVISKS